VRPFAFDAVDGSGVRRQGTEIASNELDLDRQLSARGLVLINARPTRSKGKVTPRSVIDLFYYLSVILGAGVPMLQGIRDVQESGENPLSPELADMERRIEGGTSLSEALAAHPRHFPPISVALVQAGERTGRLDAILRDLVVYLEWREELRRQIRAATTYPLILLLATFGLLGILGFFVLPRFSGIFSELGVSIPGPMRVILFLRTLVVDGWPAVLAAVALVGAALWLWQRTDRGRLARDRLALRTPLLGRVIFSLELSRFCRNLAVLHSSGIPILDGLSLTSEIVQNRVIRAAVEKAIDRLRAGAGLTEALHPERVFPSMVLRMLQMGETTGCLDEALEHVTRFYDRDVPLVIERAIASFNIGTLIFMGATVVMIALSFFVPLYQMLGSLNAS
jgi:type IV pilus assembly protein PilC